MNFTKPIYFWAILFFPFTIFSQVLETDSSSTPLQSESPHRQLYQLNVSRISLDERINQGFAPFGNGVGDIIFYAPNIGEDVLLGEKGKGRLSESFYQQPPFTIAYEYKSSVDPDLSLIYEIKRGDTEEEMIIRYPVQREVKWGEKLVMNGKKVVISMPEFSEYDAETNQLPVYIESEGQIPVNSLKVSLDPIDAAAKISDIPGYKIMYQEQKTGRWGETIEVNGIQLTITENTGSSFEWTSTSVLTFQIVPISFLPIIILILILGATYFTIYFRFINIRKFGLALNVVRGKYSDPKEKGEVSHFQALTTALSGTVGLGNIAGVAIAISIGGAGATFWMILVGLLGMSSKFVECTLGVKYRRVNEKGVVSGGPMYYLSTGLAEKGYGWIGKIAAIFFSIMCIGASYGSGNMFQVNQAFQQFQLVTGGESSFIAGYAWIFGLAMAILVAMVIIGGIRSIANVTEKIVPIMCGIYVLGAIIILGLNANEIPRAFTEIITEAFAPLAIAGGFLGVLIQGFRRGAFSNEAGVGSASIAHAAVKTNHPASEGIVSLLEPFIDTVVVCTMTALVIIITNNHLDPNASDGVALTSAAFSGEIPFFQYILSIAVILFAFSTMISWSYYGLKSWTYLFGDTPIADITYKLSFCIFIVIGAAASLGSVMAFSDAMIFAMSFPNIIGLVILSPVVKEELQKYLEKIRTGEIVRVS